MVGLVLNVLFCIEAVHNGRDVVNFLPQIFLEEYRLRVTPEFVIDNPAFGFIAKGVEFTVPICVFTETRSKKAYDYYGDFEGWVETAYNQYTTLFFDGAIAFKYKNLFVEAGKKSERSFKYRFYKERYDEFHVKKEIIDFETDGVMSKYIVGMGAGYKGFSFGVSVDYITSVIEKNGSKKENDVSFSAGLLYISQPNFLIGISYSNKTSKLSSLLTLFLTVLFPFKTPVIIEPEFKIDVEHIEPVNFKLTSSHYLTDKGFVFYGTDMSWSYLLEGVTEKGISVGGGLHTRNFIHTIGILITAREYFSVNAPFIEEDEMINELNFYICYRGVYEF